MKKLLAALIAGPSLLFALGYLLNFLVMAANHGQMPVLFPGGGCGPEGFFSEDLVHVCMTAQSHLRFLADWIAMIENGRLHSMMSPGDFLEMAGQISFLPSLWISLGVIAKKIFE